MLQAIPYKLINKVQNYEWGTKNEEAFIPNLLGFNPEKNIPYAELWIGAHPKASSAIEINSTLYLLNNLIKQFPLEILGEYVINKFGYEFPFLLKVLSASRSLSIQAHPDKVQAEELHKKDPANYPDCNHKPEIAIAVDSLKAIAGFADVDEIINNLIEYAEILTLAGISIEEITEAKSALQKEMIIRKVYSEMMIASSHPTKIEEVITSVKNKISKKENISKQDELFVEQFNLYGCDIGLLSFYFFNYLELKENQAIYTGSGIPHAYIKGNIIECMANSDNVVRAGLTNKFKDVETLINIIDYRFGKYEVLNSEQSVDEVKFNTQAEEFEITLFNKSSYFCISINPKSRPIIVLVTKGALNIIPNKKPTNQIYAQKGDAIFLPAIINHLELTGDEAQFYIVTIP
jgi:mannose-6-phosphate isomerase